MQRYTINDVLYNESKEPRTEIKDLMSSMGFNNANGRELPEEYVDFNNKELQFPITYGPLSIVRVEKGILHLELKPFITNHNAGSPGTLRFIGDREETVKFEFQHSDNHIWLRTKDNNADYGYKGMHHVARSCCLGSFVVSWLELLQNGDSIPITVLLQQILYFLAHRNTDDVAGNWTRYDESRIRRVEDNRPEFFPTGIEIVSWGRMNQERILKAWNISETKYLESLRTNN